MFSFTDLIRIALYSLVSLSLFAKSEEKSFAERRSLAYVYARLLFGCANLLATGKERDLIPLQCIRN